MELPTSRRPLSGHVARLAVVGVLAAYGTVCLRDPGRGRLLDMLDLAIHETGHLVFAPFGETLMLLGGTIFQLIVPLAFVGHFARRGSQFSAAVCLWWVAQSCWNVSVYAADARAMELPLVGGGEHDWAILLGDAGWLPYDARIARGIHLVGVLLFVASLWIAARAAGRSPGAAGPPLPEGGAA